MDLLSLSEPEDYSAVSRVLTFLSPLSVRGTIRIPIEDDTIDDDGESFFVDLFIPPEDMDSVQLSPQRTVVRIIDNDGKPENVIQSLQLQHLKTNKGHCNYS